MATHTKEGEMELTVRIRPADSVRLTAMFARHFAGLVADAAAASKAAGEYPCLSGLGERVALSPFGESVTRRGIYSSGGSHIEIGPGGVLSLHGLRGSFANLGWACAPRGLEEALLSALLGAEVELYLSQQPWRRIDVAGVWLTVENDHICLARQDWPGAEVAGNCPECGCTLGPDAVWLAAEENILEGA
ncbi:MAG: hypothetical protein WC291_10405, partial [Thermodesulfovibrionales bacterium]